MIVTNPSQLYHLADRSLVSTSLCPTLGKMYAQVYPGVCPLHLQEPFGKKLNISFIGPTPFITYNPVGGSAFIVMSMLANKYKFIPNYIPAKGFGIVEKNNTKFGMLYKVTSILGPQ